MVTACFSVFLCFGTSNVMTKKKNGDKTALVTQKNFMSAESIFSPKSSFPTDSVEIG